MFDYETLKLIWWLLVGVLLLGFAIMDGHDMGVGTLLPFAGKDDVERRVIINTVGPHWDGNQVWFITGGGAIFAAITKKDLHEVTHLQPSGQLAEMFMDHIVPIVICRDIGVSQALAFARPVLHYETNCPASHDIRSVADWIIDWNEM